MLGIEISCAILGGPLDTADSIQVESACVWGELWIFCGHARSDQARHLACLRILPGHDRCVHRARFAEPVSGTDAWAQNWA